MLISCQKRMHILTVPGKCPQRPHLIGLRWGADSSFLPSLYAVPWVEPRPMDMLGEHSALSHTLGPPVFEIVLCFIITGPELVPFLPQSPRFGDARYPTMTSTQTYQPSSSDSGKLGEGLALPLLLTSPVHQDPERAAKHTLPVRAG